MKKNKNLILEIIILITILGSVGVIYYIYKELNGITPKYSDSNKIVNYSKNRYIKIDKSFDNISTYNVPETDYIDYSISSYDYFITSTDNRINTITEIIEIYYLDNQNIETQTFADQTINTDAIKNYCNAYNEVTGSYKTTCTYYDNRIELNNIYNLETIFTDDIETKNFTIKKDVKYNDLLNTYLENLSKNNISYKEVDKIE